MLMVEGKAAVSEELAFIFQASKFLKSQFCFGGDNCGHYAV